MLCKALIFTAVPAVTAGAAAGGAAATHYLGGYTTPGAYYGVPTYDHADPYHSDPGGEWVRIEAAPTIGTASVHHLVAVPAV